MLFKLSSGFIGNNLPVKPDLKYFVITIADLYILIG